MKIKEFFKGLQEVLFKIFVVTLLIYLAGVNLAKASEHISNTTLDLNVTSIHTKTNGLNQGNYGFGITKYLDHHWNVSGGFYENSYDKTSKYLFIGVKHDQHHWRFGIDAGFVTGYDNIRTDISTTTCSGHDDYDDDHGNRCNTFTESNGLNNLDEYQFVVLPYTSYLYDKNHTLKFSFIPPITNNSELVITMQYQYGGLELF